MIAAKYIRLSSADEAARYGEKSESVSVTHQRMLLDRYIAEHAEFEGCAALEFLDDGRSGTNFDRPGVKALLNAARHRRIDCILVKDFTRFGRNALEVDNYIEQVFPFLGIRFISVNDGYDSADYPHGSAGDLGNGFRTLIGEMYSVDLSRKSKAAKRQYAQRGQIITPYPIYGYVKSPEDKRAWVPDPEAAPVVRQIFRRFLDGLTAVEIARELNAQGVPTRSQHKRAQGSTRQLWNSERLENEWSGAAVGKMLRDERYTGKLVSLKSTRTEVGGKSVKDVPKGEWVVVPNAFEAIITQEVFDRAGKELQQRAHPRAASAPDSGRLFIRKLRCAGCGLALVRRRQTAGWHYVCGGRAWSKTDDCQNIRLSEEKLKQAVLESIHMQAGLAREAELRLDRQDDERRRVEEAEQKRRRFIQMKLERLTGQKKEIFLRYDGGELSLAEFDAQCRALTQKADEYRKALTNGSADDDPAQAAHTLLRRGQINDLKSLEQIQTLDRKTIDRLIHGIKVYAGNRIEISWNFSDPF